MRDHFIIKDHIFVKFCFYNPEPKQRPTFSLGHHTISLRRFIITLIYLEVKKEKKKNLSITTITSSSSSIMLLTSPIFTVLPLLFFSALTAARPQHQTVTQTTNGTAPGQYQIFWVATNLTLFTDNQPMFDLSSLIGVYFAGNPRGEHYLCGQQALAIKKRDATGDRGNKRSPVGGTGPVGQLERRSSSVRLRCQTENYHVFDVKLDAPTAAVPYGWYLTFQPQQP